jgi:4-amino-4-deoxy-L-arabinose transferase-like glycosyltransferase
MKNVIGFAIKYKIFFIIILIIVLGFLLRLHNLTSKSIWYDEAKSIQFAENPLWKIISKPNSTPPLYFIILKFWIDVFGDSEFAVRFPSIIFGSASLLLIYWIGKKTFNELVGLYSAFILAISSFHIFYSQETRNFTLFLFLTLVSMFIFIKILKKEKVKYYFYLTLVNILIIYTDIFGIFLILTQTIIIYVSKEGLNKRLYLPIILALIFFCPYLFFMSKNIRNILFDGLWWTYKPNLSSIIDTFKTFSYGGSRYGGLNGGVVIIPKENLDISKNLLYIFTFLSLFGLTKQAGIIQRKNNADNRHGIVLLLSWLGIPIVGSFLFSYIFYPIYIIRHLIFVSPAFYILVSYGIASIRKKLLQILSVISILFFSLFSLNYYYTHDLKIPWAKVCQYLTKNSRENDIITIAHLKESIFPINYYFIKDKIIFKINKINILMPRPSDFKCIKKRYVSSHLLNKKENLSLIKPINFIVSADSLDEFKKNIEFVWSSHLVNKKQNIWFIHTRWLPEKNIKNYLLYFNTFYSKIDEKVFEGVSIIYYEPK